MESLKYCTQKLQSLGLNKESNKFEICWEKSASVSIEAQDGKIDSLTRSVDQGISIRTLRDGKMGFSYTFDLSNAAIDKAIQTALAVGDLLPNDEYNDLANFGDYPYTDIQNHDRKGLDQDLKNKIEMALEIESQAIKLDPRIKRVRGAGFDQSSAEMILIDSNGERIRHETSIFTIGLSCVSEENGVAEYGSDAQYSNYFDQLNISMICKNAVQNATELMNSGKTKTMQCPAVFKNSIVAQLLGFLASSFSAENIDKNFSLLTGKLGEKIFSEKINLSDDALSSGGIVTRPFDGEGTPSKTNLLVENGTLKTYLFDQYYARKWNATNTSNFLKGITSTSSSRRGSLKSPPSIGTSNFILKPGHKSFEELLKTAHQGIYITSVMGLHTANPVTGDFSLGASGILIENGVLTRPVKGFAIAGNFLALMKKVVEVGKDTRSFGTVVTPSLLFSELSIGGI